MNAGVFAFIFLAAIAFVIWLYTEFLVGSAPPPCLNMISVLIRKNSTRNILSLDLNH